jgi:hypothetical protein
LETDKGFWATILPEKRRRHAVKRKKGFVIELIQDKPCLGHKKEFFLYEKRAGNKSAFHNQLRLATEESTVAAITLTATAPLP